MAADDLRAQLEPLLDADEHDLRTWLDEHIQADHPQLAKLAPVLAARGRIEALLFLLDHHTLVGGRRIVDAVAAAMSVVGVERITAQLQADLRSDAPEVRRGAALYAGLLELDALGPALIEALGDTYFLTRMEAATALGRLGHVPAVAELRKSLRDEDILTRGAAIEALTQIPDPELLTAYTGYFDDDEPAYYFGVFDDAEPRARLHAIDVLRHLRPACAVAALTHLLESAADADADADADEPRDELEQRVIDRAQEVLAELRGGEPPA